MTWSHDSLFLIYRKLNIYAKLNGKFHWIWRAPKLWQQNHYFYSESDICLKIDIRNMATSYLLKCYLYIVQVMCYLNKDGCTEVDAISDHSDWVTLALLPIRYWHMLGSAGGVPFLIVCRNFRAKLPLSQYPNISPNRKPNLLVIRCYRSTHANVSKV